MKRILVHVFNMIMILFAIWDNLKRTDSPVFWILIFPYIVANFAVFLMLLLSLRNRPKATDENPIIIVIATVAANLPLFIPLLGIDLISSRPILSVQLAVAAFRIVTVPFYLAAVWQLGTNLTVLPEANRLRTTGIYAYSRHPLYAFYLLWNLAQILVYQSWGGLLVSLLQSSLHIVRARREERILARVFPEYAEYRERVGWFGRRQCDRAKGGV